MVTELEHHLWEKGTAGIFTRLARLGLLVEGFQRETLEGSGISFIEFSALRVLELAGPPHAMSASELAGYILRSSGGVTQIVDRLVEKGLVERGMNPDDRRQILVTLTGEGKTLTDGVQDRYAAARETMMADLSEEEIERIDEALYRLLEVIGDSERPAHLKG